MNRWSLLANTTGSSNFGLGNLSLTLNTTGSRNVVVGDSSLAANTTEDDNVAIGYQASQAQKAGSNTTIGSKSLWSNITGTANAALGFEALYYNKSATSTVAVGYYAAHGAAAFSNQFTVMGRVTAGRNLATGSDNILIGDDVRNGLTVTSSNQLNIGNLLFSNSVGTGATAATGNIGVGTSTPWGKLSVTGAGTGTGVNFLLANSANTPIFKVLDDGTATLTGGLTASALSSFSGGLTAYASSTIGDGTQTGGLTISGGATTTGNAYFAGNVGIATTSPSLPLSVGDDGTYSAYFSKRVGVGTNAPAATLSVVAPTALDGLHVHAIGVTYAMRFFNDTYSTTNAVGSFYPQTSGVFQLGSDNGLGLQLYAGASTPVNIKSNGQIGLGLLSTSALGAGDSVGIYSGVAASTTLSVYGAANQTANVFQVEPIASSYGLFLTSSSTLVVSKGTTNTVTAPTTIDKDSFYYGVGGGEYGQNSYRLLGFGYNGNSWGKPTSFIYPAYIGYQEMDSSIAAYGDLIFGTRPAAIDESIDRK